MLREIDIQPSDTVVFIHIPKTAGVTFSTLLHPLLAELPWCPVILPQDLIQIPYAEILQYRLFTGHFYFRLVNKLLPAGFLFMTFLREPVSRTISHYEYLIRQETFGNFDWANNELKLAKKMSLKEFVDNNQLHIALDIVDLQTKFLGGVRDPNGLIMEEQAEPSIEKYVQKVSKELNLEPLPVEEFRFADKENLENAKKQLDQAAFFGITERFQDSLFLMSFTFGWPPVFDSLRLNDKPKTEHTQQPAGETLELIKSKLALDLELYQFGQTLFEQRFHAMTELLVKEYAGPVITDSDQPLRKEVLYELLQKHYEVRRNRRNQKLLKAIGPTYLYSPAEHTEGNFGWHTVEMSDVHGAMVWSGPGLESGFDLPCPRGENIQVSFCVLMTIKSDIIEKLALKVNGIPVTLQFQNDPQGAFVFTGRLPAKAISGSFLRLVFSVPYTLAPCDITLDNKDSRLLGFLLNWLKLEAQGEHAKRETMSQITNPEQIASLIQSVGFWYHQIELAPGITTPGMNASLKVLENLDSLGLPKEAKGLRVLDIGCRDGYFAFEMERRGAEVIGIDYAPSHTTGFDVAAKILDSKVPYILENVYNLIPETYGTFDIVLFLGVIYHLRNPLLALDKIRTVMKPEGLLFVESAIATDETIAALDIPVWRFYPNNSLNQDATNKWAPNMIGLQAVVEEAGFQIQRSLSGVARGYVKAQAIVDIQQQHFQQLDSSKGILGVKKI